MLLWLIIFTEHWDKEDCDDSVAKVLQTGNGPCERELALPVTVSHVDEIDDDEEDHKDCYVVNDYEYVPADLLQPIYQSERTQNA